MTGRSARRKRQMWWAANGEILPPVASNVAIVGALTIGRELTGDYDYTDPNTPPLPEDGTTYAWYLANDAGGSGEAVIATTLNYTVAMADDTKYLDFGVTPSNGVLVGTEVRVGYQQIGMPGTVLFRLLSVMANLFQNNDGTNVVTAVGQGVKSIRDISPNARLLTHPSATPGTYEENTGDPAVEQTDSSNCLACAVTGFSTTKLALIGAFSRDGTINSGDYFFYVGQNPAVSSSFGVQQNGTTALRVYVNNTAHDFVHTIPISTKFVLTVLFDGTKAAGDRVRLRINGADIANADAGPTAIATAMTALSLAGAAGLTTVTANNLETYALALITGFNSADDVDIDAWEDLMASIIA